MGAKMTDHALELTRQACVWIGVAAACIAIAATIIGHFASTEKERRAEAQALNDREAYQTLEQRIADRTLSQPQLQDILDALRPLAIVPESGNPQMVAVFPTVEQVESTRLADQIALAMNAAGWNVNRNTVTYGRPYRVRGVAVLPSTDARSIATSTAAIEALRAAGLTVAQLPPREALPGGTVGVIDHNAAISVFVGER